MIAARVHLTCRDDNDLKRGDRDVTSARQDSYDVEILSYTYTEIDPSAVAYDLISYPCVSEQWKADRPKGPSDRM